MAFTAGLVICLFGGALPIAASVALFSEWSKISNDPGVSKEFKDNMLHLAISLIVLGFIGFVIGVTFFYSKQVKEIGVAAKHGFEAAKDKYRADRAPINAFADYY